jgi:hypothetical protein
MTLHALDSRDLDGTNKVQVQANLVIADRNDALLEQVISRLSLEPGVSAVSWKVDANGTAWKFGKDKRRRVPSVRATNEMAEKKRRSQSRSASLCNQTN